MRSLKMLRIGALSSLLALVTFSPRGLAQVTNDWTYGGGGNVWSDPSNWGIPPNPFFELNTIRFFGSTAFTSVNDMTTDGNTYFQVQQLHFFNTAQGQLSGNDIMLTDNGAGTMPQIVLSNSASMLVLNNLILSNHLTITGDGAGGLTNAGVISGFSPGFGVTKSGTSRLVLTGANTFAGGFTNNGGTVLINNAQALGLGGLTLNAGTLASLDATALTLTNATTIGGDITLGQAVGGAGALTFTNTIDLGGATRNVAVNNASNLFLGNIGNGGLIKTGTGQLVLGGNNTYAGGTAISNGTLSVSSDANLGAVPGAATPGNLIISGGTLNSTADLTINSNRGVAVGPSTGSGGGALDVASGTTLSIAGIVANDGAGTGKLTKNGTGTLVLAGANTFSGGLAVNGGTVRGNVFSGTSAGVVTSVLTNGFGTGAISLGGATLSFTPVASTATNGITGRFFTTNGANVYGGAPAVNNYLSGTPFDVSTYTNLNFNAITVANPAIPATHTNNYGVQWLGKLFITNGGLTQFSLATDDGSRMYIDGVLVTDRNNNGTATGSINLSSGLHDVRIEMGQGTGGNTAALSYQPVDFPALTVVSSNVLFTSESATNNLINMGNGVNLGAGTSSVLDLQGSNFTGVGMGTLNASNNSALTVTALAGKTVAFTGSTFAGGTVNLTNTPNVSLGQLNDGGTAVTVSKTGSGRLILDQTALNNTMSGSSIFDIQAGTLVINGTTNGANPAGRAQLQLNGGNLIIDTKFGTFALTNSLNILPVTTTLNGTNTISNGSTLTLDVQQPGASGTATLVMTGPVSGSGSIVKSGVGALTLSGPLGYNGTTFLNGGAVTMSGNSGAYSTGTLTLNAGSLTVTGNNGYSGATVVNNGTVTVSGANGRLSGTSGLTFASGTTLTIGANTDTTWLDRVRDGVPLNLNRSTLVLNGSLVAGVNRENIGADFVFGGGLNTITLAPAAGNQVELATDALTRNNRSTLLLRGTGLGSNGNNTARFFVTNTPPAVIGGGGATDSKNISIVPWIAGDSVAAGNGTNFVTYTAAAGFRPLNTSTEYVLTPMSGVSGSGNFNTPATGEYFTNGSATVNALRLTGGTVDLANTNSTLALGSGALMFTATSTIQNGTVAFGANEAVVHLSAGAAVTGTINSKLTGTGGLTVSSSGTASTLTLGGNNSGLSGVVTINGSTVNIANDINLGTAPGVPTPGALNLANSTLNVTADTTLNANRGIAILPGGGTLSVGANNTVSYGGIIAGATTNTFTKAGTGTLNLTGNNTYQGPTVITAGRLQVASDTALGASPAAATNNLVFNGGTLGWMGASDTLTNRGILLTGAGIIDVTSAGATLTSLVAAGGTGALTKVGAGTLLLGGTSTNSGVVTVAGGNLAIAGNAASMQNVVSFLINSNGLLSLGSPSDTVSNPNRLSDGAAIGMFSGGELRLNGTADPATVTETVGAVTNFFGTSTYTVAPTAGNQAVLNVSGALGRVSGAATGANPVILVRGTGLGAAAAPDTSRILFGGTPTTNNSGGGGAAGTTSISIIPWMVGDPTATGSGNTFVTYDGANGLRPLNTATELNATPLDGTPLANDNFTTAGENLTLASITVNALRQTGGTLDLGGFNLTNQSGALLFTGAASITNGGLQFSNREAIVTLASAAPITVGIGSAIATGTNGLTVSATTAGSVLLLSGANTYS
ncbi:MAG: autotransporter-associated beta strand repeat-containing protein, partial [Verrucomicrobia bacterium]|nr:autotransporter-associated beta strand repeat-containing protein [Verrucomicrobiota bacterium]